MLLQALQPNEGEVEELRGHVVIAGFGRVGQIIAQLLSERLIPFVALDVRSDRVQVCLSHKHVDSQIAVLTLGMFKTFMAHFNLSRSVGRFDIQATCFPILGMTAGWLLAYIHNLSWGRMLQSLTDWRSVPYIKDCCSDCGGAKQLTIIPWWKSCISLPLVAYGHSWQLLSREFLTLHYWKPAC